MSSPVARAESRGPTPPAKLGAQAFSRDLSRLLLTFVAVAAVDGVFGSLLTGRIRLWFPQWVDPAWATNSDALVVYSQSYLAGVFLLPVLAWIIDRDFLSHRGRPARASFWAVCLLTLLAIVLWKGELMLSHDKQGEAVAIGVLTALIYGLVVIGRSLPARLADWPPRLLLRRLLLALAVFFLAMSVIDPVLQVGVQGMAWSRGLVIEMAFFIPAGVALWVIARAMKRRDEVRANAD